jgi:uncharacterized protein (DUF1501 family)
MNKRKSRRNFIKNASIACMGLGFGNTIGAMSDLRKLGKILAPNPPFNDYKAMVYFFLHGGNDGFNMLMPKTGSAYDDYVNTRTNLALSNDENNGGMLPIGNGDFGIHPSLADMKNLYGNGELAFISNIGSMIEPMTKDEYLDDLKAKPLGLYSHSDQFKHWQTSQPNVRTNIGWGGRTADLIGSNNLNDNISMNVSLSGSNIFQFGNDTIEFSISSSGAIKPSGWDSGWGHHPERRTATDSILNATYADMYRKTYVDIFRDSIEAAEEFEAAIAQISDFNTQFGTHYISQNMEMVAKTIAAKDILNFDRQIFFVRYGGWDHHNELLLNQEEKFAVVNNALFEFSEALKEIGMFDDVATFVVSEFGRKLASNGNGTDHAWGSNVMLMGGKVQGNNMYGTYPSLAIDSGQYVHNGVIIPTTPTDSLFSELALWFGVDPLDLPTVFPNLANFHDINNISESNPPIGFMDFT